MASRSRFVLPVAVLAAILGGCVAFDTPDNYDRHRLTDITLPRERSDVFYFDVTTTAEFPADSAVAEARRLQWLNDWLQLRQMCPDGHEVVKRREFGLLEDNPARRDLRYEVRCQPGTGGSASGPAG